MFLSFIVPVYNSERYLEECLESLVKQDISLDEYEIICVNDGSIDGSLTILNDYKARYNNFVIIDKENKGVSAARNDGLNAAAGEYVWFVDSDDFIEKDILNELYFCIKKGADVIQFGAYPFRDTLSLEEKELYKTGMIQPKSYANNVFVTRNVFKKEFLNSHGIEFYTELNYSEDKVFMSKVLANDPTVELLEKNCYFYRFHAGSAIAVGNLVEIDKKMFMWIFSISCFQEAYAVCPQTYKAAIADNLMSEVYNCLYTISGLPSNQYKNLKMELRERGVLDIKRPKECTLKESYLVNNLSFIGKLFNFIYVHLDSKIGLAAMRCLRLANQKRKYFIKD